MQLLLQSALAPYPFLGVDQSTYRALGLCAQLEADRNFPPIIDTNLAVDYPVYLKNRADALRRVWRTLVAGDSVDLSGHLGTALDELPHTNPSAQLTY